MKLDFFNKLMDIMTRDLDTDGGAERVEFQTHRRRDTEDCISINYTFQKQGPTEYSAAVWVGTQNHVLCVHIDSTDARNHNEATILEKMIILTDDEYKLVTDRFNTYIAAVLKKKYDKSDDDVLMTVFPRLVEEAILS